MVENTTLLKVLAVLSVLANETKRLIQILMSLSWLVVLCSGCGSDGDYNIAYSKPEEIVRAYVDAILVDN